MFADVGTRLVTNLNEVKQDSVWINGFDWMIQDKSSVPAKMIDDIKLNHGKMSALQKNATKKIC